MRVLCAAAVSLTLGLLIAFAKESRPLDDKDRAEKFAAQKKKFDTDFAELEKKARAATDPTQRRVIALEARELSIITAQKVLDLIGADAQTPDSFDMLQFVAQITGRFGGGKEFDKAAELIAEHHLNNPKVKDLIPMLARGGLGSLKLLQAAAEKSTDQQVKGLALFFLGLQAAESLEDEEDEKRIDAIIAKASDYFQKAIKEAGDVKLGGTTVGKEATAQLEGIKDIKNLAVGKPAPDVENMTLEGKKVKLSDYKGNVVLLDIWATWCPPCRAMIPHERDMVKNLKDKPFRLVSVSADDQKETLIKFLEKEPMPWIHWWDNGTENPVLKKYRVRAFPTLYLIDHTGVIRYKWVGSPGNDKLDKAVDELVTEALKAKG
jgi:thiol-disulfide isomerase/thioredoxin/cation transport regulator ChaC